MGSMAQASGASYKLIEALAEEGKQAEEGDRQKAGKGQGWWSRGGACEQEGAPGTQWQQRPEEPRWTVATNPGEGTLSMPRTPQGHRHRPRPGGRGRGTRIPSWSFPVIKIFLGTSLVVQWLRLPM